MADLVSSVLSICLCLGSDRLELKFKTFLTISGPANLPVGNSEAVSLEGLVPSVCHTDFYDLCETTLLTC